MAAFIYTGNNQLNMSLTESTNNPIVIRDFLTLKTENVWSILTMAGAQMGTIVGLTLSGFIVDLWGWEAVFYIEGPLVFIFLAMWMLLVYDSPDQHPRISNKEKAYIAAAMGKNDTHKQVNVLSIM